VSEEGEGTTPKVATHESGGWATTEEPCGQAVGTSSTKQSTNSNRVDNTVTLAIMHTHHNNLLAGHLRWNQTITTIKHKYWWPCMSGKIAAWVASCKLNTGRCLNRAGTGL
jgi:hypothetical protein